MVDPDPTTSGGFGDVYQGTLDGSSVCIKRVRMYRDSLQRVTKVRRRRYYFFGSSWSLAD